MENSVYQPASTSHVHRARKAYTVRRWSVRHARLLEIVYLMVSDVLLRLHPLFIMIGYGRIEKPVVFVERLAKGFLFDCRMCGHCVLSSTGMSCPMNCPKQLRNGPCGGVRLDGNCEVEPEMPCVWTEAWEGNQKMKHGDLIMDLQMPLDQSLRETSSWLRATAERAAERKKAKGAGADTLVAKRAEASRGKREGRSITDLDPHLADVTVEPPPGHSSRGRLERVLRRGDFAVTAELDPPDSADPKEVYERGAVFDGWVDGINATDGSGANCHMSSVSICALLTRVGYAPVMQITCRDQNRIAIQGHVLGAAAMGVNNILCLTGDGVQAGDQPGAKPVFDLDSISLLETIRTMRDDGRFLSGRKITTRPRVFLGAAANPFVKPHGFRPLRLAKKIEAGAQFIQTQYCFDIPMLERYMAEVRDLGLHEKCFILIGVGPLASARAAKWIRANVPGVHIPDDVIVRLEGAADHRLEGKNICIEMMQRIKEIPGIAGVHVMAYRQEELVADIIKESGVLAGRKPWKKEPNPSDPAVNAAARGDQHLP